MKKYQDERYMFVSIVELCKETRRYAQAKTRGWGIQIYHGAGGREIGEREEEKGKDGREKEKKGEEGEEEEEREEGKKGKEGEEGKE